MFEWLRLNKVFIVDLFASTDPVFETQMLFNLFVGFMTAIVEPLFKEWNYFAPTKRSRTMLDNLVFNKKKWDEKLEEESGRRHMMTTVAITEKPSNLRR